MEDPETKTLKPFFIFFEAKSREETADAARPRCFDQEQDTHQFKKIEAACKSLQGKDDKDLSACGRSFKEGNYLFVYLTTTEGRDQDESRNKLFIMRKDSTKAFFGPCFDLFAASRSTWNEKYRQNQK